MAIIVNHVNARAAAVPLSARRESYAERVDGPARPHVPVGMDRGVRRARPRRDRGRLGDRAVDANRTGYVAGVLANVGTTLLLVGIVVLLERRIVDTAVRAVRNAHDEARRAARDDFDAQMRDLEERIRTSWGDPGGRQASAPDGGEVLRRIVDAESGVAERETKT